MDGLEENANAASVSFWPPCTRDIRMSAPFRVLPAHARKLQSRSFLCSRVRGLFSELMKICDYDRHVRGLRMLGCVKLVVQVSELE
jgi:hypothetical protein